MAVKNTSNLVKKKLNRSINNAEQLPALMALSLVPSLSDILNQDEIDKLNGALRRGNISILQSDFLLDKLDLMRQGVLNNSDDAFSRLYQFVSFLKKFPVKGNNSQCELAGLEKFKSGEEQCRVTNERLLQSKGHPGRLVALTQSIIGKILTPIKPTFLRKKVAFGTGTTVNVNGRTYEETSKFFKFTDRLLVPARQKRFLAALLSDNYALMETLRLHYHINDTGRTRMEVERLIFEKHLVVVDDSFPNRIGFVPKDSAEHRAIGVELNGSVLLQKVLGDDIRQCLLNFGLDLNSQARNQHFAMLAKVFGNATVDMKNASNTLSYETVKLHVPHDWFEYLNCFRSHYGNNQSLNYSCKYEMFSSMGNGFTFELESLIFYALSLATVMVETGCNLHMAKRQVCTYGDDVIVPATCAPRLVEELNYIGFEINEQKSFFSGHFFESCGSDFYDGKDVRPFFLKRRLETVKDIYFLCNSLLFKSVKTGSGFLVPAYLQALKSLKAVCVPDYGPLHYEDSKHGYKETNDDLECVLRVPLSYAQANGGVTFDSTIYAWVYQKWVNVAIEVPLSMNKQYTVQSAKYCTFLDGTLNGKAVLTGRNSQKLVKCRSSSWDGTLNRKDLSVIARSFE